MKKHNSDYTNITVLLNDTLSDSYIILVVNNQQIVVWHEQTGFENKWQVFYNRNMQQTL